LVDDLEPADALTVHKAQGSEFERVAILLPLRDHLLAGRSFLYTALTRARQAAWWVGTPEVAARAAARLETRHTGAPA
jgi:exodeoxyribonuclease V alpha subunit